MDEQSRQDRRRTKIDTRRLALESGLEQLAARRALLESEIKSIQVRSPHEEEDVAALLEELAMLVTQSRELEESHQKLQERRAQLESLHLEA